jgi:hypothetical protein
MGFMKNSKKSIVIIFLLIIFISTLHQKDLNAIDASDSTLITVVTSRKNLDLAAIGYRFSDIEDALMNQIQTELNQRGLKALDFRNAVAYLMTDPKIKDSYYEFSKDRFIEMIAGSKDSRDYSFERSVLKKIAKVVIEVYIMSVSKTGNNMALKLNVIAKNISVGSGGAFANTIVQVARRVGPNTDDSAMLTGLIKDAYEDMNRSFVPQVIKEMSTQSNNEKTTGCISGDCENGFGVFIWSNGSKYDGAFKSGYYDGQGTMTHPDGTVQSGRWVYGEFMEESGSEATNNEKSTGCVLGDCQNGFGQYSGAFYYQGNYRNGLFHGEGLFKDNNGNAYTGEFEEGSFHGQGTAIFADGSKYIGEWYKDGKNGQGTMTYSDGTVKSGEWENDKFVEESGSVATNNEKTTGCISGDCKNGYGEIRWQNGNKYIGEWQNGKKHGQGTFTWLSGDKYVGQFENGKKHGQGTYTWPDGIKYDGQWENNEANGQGTYTWPNGKNYVGEFENFKFQGQGTMTYPDGTVKSGRWENDKLVEETGSVASNNEKTTGCVIGDCINGFGQYSGIYFYKGEYKNGLFHGEGDFDDKAGNKYTGEFEEGNFHGQGTATYADGSKYKGEWYKDEKNGQGTMTYPDGTIKSGGWKNDKFVGSSSEAVAIQSDSETGCISGDCKNGFGEFRWQNGVKYIGEWQNKTLHGQGTYIWPTGQKYVGEFKKGNFHGQGTMTYPDRMQKAGRWENDKLVEETGSVAMKIEKQNVIAREITIKNGTPFLLNLALGYKKNNRWLAEGWWQLKAYQKETVNLDGIVYYHAFSYYNTFKWSGDKVTFKIANDAFEIYDDAPPANAKPVYFKQLELPVKNEPYMHTLTGPTVYFNSETDCACFSEAESLRVNNPINDELTYEKAQTIGSVVSSIPIQFDCSEQATESLAAMSDYYLKLAKMLNNCPTSFIGSAVQGFFEPWTPLFGECSYSAKDKREESFNKYKDKWILMQEWSKGTCE